MREPIWKPSRREPKPRSELKRSGRLKSSGFIPRTVAICPYNRQRQAKRQAEGKVYGPVHRAYDDLPCFLAGHPLHRCIGPVKGHHRHRVGNGGEDIEGEIPACVSAHDELHWSEVKVEAKYGVNLDEVQERARIAVQESR